jgi:hypothetical protein
VCILPVATAWTLWQWDDDPDQLDDLVARVAKKEPSPAITAVLLQVFERHPDMDGEELKVVQRRQ